MKANEITSANYERELPCIAFEKIDPLWYVAKWNGPISGICFYEQRQHWFFRFVDLFFEKNHEEQSDFWFERYVIIELTDEQRLFERQQHDLFRKYVGHHTDFSSAGGDVSELVHPQERHHVFYDQKPDRPDYLVNEAVGWTHWAG